MTTIPCPAPLTTDDIVAGDTAWVMAASALVLIMTPGLGFFYGGLVRNKNIVNTIMMSYVSMGVIGLVWILVGYSLSFGPGNVFIGDLSWGALRNVGYTPNFDYGATIPHIAHMNFQMMFGIITPALISGGVVERMKFKSYIVFIIVWSILVYDVLAHWLWAAWTVKNSDGTCTQHLGWLRAMGAIDFAGGMVIHVSSGFSALVAAAIVGKRKGYDPKQGTTPGNIPFVMLGAALLWFGWLGFNGGSAAAADGAAAVAVANTSIAAGVAFLTWLLLDAGIKKQPSAVGAATGSVIGLVAITPASGYIEPSYSIIVGAVSVLVSYGAMRTKKYLSLDDSLDVFWCHGVGGVSGSILTGLFATLDVNPTGENGAFYGNPRLLGIQLLAIVVTVALSCTITAIILFAIKKTIGLVIDSAAQDYGIDKGTHGEKNADLIEEVKIALDNMGATLRQGPVVATDAGSGTTVHFQAWRGTSANLTGSTNLNQSLNLNNLATSTASNTSNTSSISS
eukprot:TRINITY_DN5707_c0_g1_i1.p1 TRINITY_DN5707_c0_g1~~TRINITY_DN5707_c0_g1_i1.p1  ORF type:complete len:508 (-),score=85.81 TRINITY_DN5707_c0_g1_i1:85-1608(-)